MKARILLRTSFRQLSIIGSGIFCAGLGSLHAAEIFWSSGNGEFSQGNHWVGGVVPGPDDTAILDNGGTLSIQATDPWNIGELQTRRGVVSHTGGNLSTSGDLKVGDAGASGDSSAIYRLNGGLVFPGGGVTFSGAGTGGKLDFINGMIMKFPGAPFVIGQGDGQTGEFIQQNGFLSCASELKIGSGAGAKGDFRMAAVEGINQTPAVRLTNNLIIGEAGGAGTMTIDLGSFTADFTGTSGEMAVKFGDGDGATATIAQSGGQFVNHAGPTYLGASGNASATWNIDVGATVVLQDLWIGGSDSASGTLSIQGSSVTVGRITSASTGQSILRLRGGNLIASRDEADFMSGLSRVTLEDFTSINTGEFNIAISQEILDEGGSLSKDGRGSLTLSSDLGAEYLTIIDGTLILDGTASVIETYSYPSGILRGNGTIDGDLDSEGIVAPGESTGTLSVTGNAKLSGRLEIDINSSVSNRLDVAGALDITDTTLDILIASGEANAPVYVIASYETLNGEFSEIVNLPDGYEVSYSYQGDSIALVREGEKSAYDQWTESHGLTGEQAAPEADPDHDGIVNLIEFFLGSDPRAVTFPSPLPHSERDGDHLQFTFKRAVHATSLTPVVEYSSDLENWSAASDGVNGVTITTDEADTWTVRIPSGSEGRIFARLKIDLN